jgi:hypothetical protein
MLDEESNENREICSLILETDEDYFNYPALNASLIKKITTSGFYNALEGEIDEGNKESFKLGSAIHNGILVPDTFSKNYTTIFGPIPNSEQKKTFCELVAKEGAEDLLSIYNRSYNNKKKEDEKFKEAVDLYTEYNPYISALASGKTIINKEDVDLIDKLKSRWNAHESIKELNKFRNYSELGFVFFLYNCECKIKIDRCSIDDENKIVYLLDLKTTSNAEKFKNDFFTYKYDIQMAFYEKGIMSEEGKQVFNITDEYTVVKVIVAVQKTKPFLLIWYGINFGTETQERLDEIIRDCCFKFNEWNFKNEKEKQKDLLNQCSTITF